LSHTSFEKFLDFITSLLGKRKIRDERAYLKQEIGDLINEGRAKGLISSEESRMVQGVLHLKQIQAHSIMVPRTDISSAPINATLGEVIELVNECGHTRIPISKDSLDKIVGILHAKDLLKLWGKDPHSTLPRDILRKPHFVPYTKSASEVLKELKEKKTHLAIVMDDYGGTAGIITAEDIIEEIVGEIMDEHDHDPPLLTVISPNTVSVDARLEIEKLAEHFGIELPQGDFESVGGFIINLVGKVPKVNEKVVFNNLEMIIQSADMRKIHRILVRHLPSAPKKEAHEAEPL